MQLIFNNIIIGLALVVVSHGAYAQISLGLPFSGKTMKECRSFKKVNVETDLKAALNRAMKIKTPCKRAEILFNIAYISTGTKAFDDFTRHGPKKSFHGSYIHEVVQRKLVEALYSAKDTVGTINQANIYLDTYPKSKFSRSIHYTLLMSQNSRIRSAKNSQADTYISLGLDPDQKKYEVVRNVIQLANGVEFSLAVEKNQNPDFNEHAYRRSFGSFIDQYGNLKGKDLDHVFSLYDSAAVLVQEKEFEIGMYYYKKKHYMAAIGRFKLVTNAGPAMGLTDSGDGIWDIWDKSAYYTALSFVEMGKAMLGLKTHTQFSNMSMVQQSIESVIWHLDKKSMFISDKKIGAWLRMYPSDYTPGKNGHPSRMDLARISFKNAGMIVNELKNERPANGKFSAEKLSKELNGKVSQTLLELVPDVKSLLNL